MIQIPAVTALTPASASATNPAASIQTLCCQGVSLVCIVVHVMCIAAGCLYLRDRITLTRQKTPRLRKKFDSNQLKSRDRIPSVLFLAMKSTSRFQSVFRKAIMEKVSIVFFFWLQKCFSISTRLSCQTTLTGFSWNLLDSRKLFLSALPAADFWAKKYPALCLDWQLSSSFYRTRYNHKYNQEPSCPPQV